MKIRPVILSGGSGTRMWPVSRARYPKQFAELHGDTCLFARTLELVADRSVYAAPIIVANVDHKFLILDILDHLKIKDATIILEPVGRNTAAAAIVAAISDRNEESDMPQLVMPSDHIITNPAEFQRLVQAAIPSVKDGHFVLMGVQPDRPETGFGYIVPKAAATEVKQISLYVEKPPVDKATKLITEGALWNCGIFFYTWQTLCAEAATLAPETLAQCEVALKNSTIDLGCITLASESYGQIFSEPFDRAIMEKTAKGNVIPGSFGWSDVGSWQTLWQIADQDKNHTVKDGNVVARDVKGSYLRSYGPTVAVLGVENLAIVATKDAVLVAPLSRSQEIRDLVADVSKSNSHLANDHPRVMRPWGSYEGIASGNRFQVKQITVLPGRSLSRQMHHHRAEHWVVVEGTAKIECNGEEKMIYPNESVFIPIGSVHRLSNPGLVDLNLIEVQSGDYVGEDDIVRFEDKYGRC